MTTICSWVFTITPFTLVWMVSWLFQLLLLFIFHLIWRFAWHSNTTYPKHLPWKFSIEHMSVGVNPHGRCAPQIAKLPPKITKEWFQDLWVNLGMYSGVTPKLSPCAIPEDSAHTAANFDTLPSAGKLLFIHEILDQKSLLCPQHVYQISKLEDWLKKRYSRFTSKG
jgi:hypothetical protein